MSDVRDTNHDGKVSLMEKVKDKMHGHNNTTHNNSTVLTTHNSTFPTTSAIPASGFVPAAMPISTGAVYNNTGSTFIPDSRDLNRDGHVSLSEKLAGTHISNGPAFDSRDLNRDGYVSTGERLAAGSGYVGRQESAEEMRLRLHEEQLAISKREVGAGEVDIHKRVHEQHVSQTVPVLREEVIVERHPLSGIADPNARIAPQDETLRVALFREEIVTEKRVVPTEEVIVRKQEIVDQQVVGATLRSEHIETVQTGVHSSALSGGVYDARDSNRDGHVSMGEKVKGAAMGSGASTGMYDARDSNRDGHVSMGEKVKGAVLGTAPKAARG